MNWYRCTHNCPHVHMCILHITQCCNSGHTCCLAEVCRPNSHARCMLVWCARPSPVTPPRPMMILGGVAVEGLACWTGCTMSDCQTRVSLSCQHCIHGTSPVCVSVLLGEQGIVNVVLYWVMLFYTELR